MLFMSTPPILRTFPAETQSAVVTPLPEIPLSALYSLFVMAEPGETWRSRAKPSQSRARAEPGSEVAVSQVQGKAHPKPEVA
jgi:hypothetical protein